jgi:uncharacterized membrane protein
MDQYVKIFEDHYITIELENGQYIVTNNATKDKSKLKVESSGLQLEALPKEPTKEPAKDPKDVQH